MKYEVWSMKYEGHRDVKSHTFQDHHGDVRSRLRARRDRIDDLQNYCLGACNGVVKCVVRPAAHMPKTGQGHSVHTTYDRRKLMTLNNHRSVVVLPIFTPNTLLERACFGTKWKCFGFENETRNGEMAGVQSWLSVGLAAPVRERNVNVGGRWTSVIPSFHVWYWKLKYPSREDVSNNVLNLKIWSNMTPVGTFFRSNAELNSSFPCQLYRRRIGGQLTLV